MTTPITDVKVILTAPEGINLIVVKIETNQPGLHGFGCATFAYRHVAVKYVIEEYLRPLLIGRDAEAIEELWQLMHQNAYWRNGPIENNAISGVDMALWDLKGKMANMPLYQLFGGKCREGVPVYRHADGRDLGELCENIQKYREQGITHIRCQSGGYGGGGYGKAPTSAPRGAVAGVYLDSKQYMRDTLKLFDGIRSRIGFDVELCHDVHERLKPIEAIRFARELEPFDLFFLEDAIALEEGEWIRQLREKTSTPLAQGELFNNPYEWRFLITERLIDFIRVHLSQIGGITAGRKLQIFAEQFGVRTAWHGPGDMSPLGHAANIHIDLAARNFGVQEWSGTEPPNFVIQELKGPTAALLDVFQGLPEFRDGYVYANERPGLGVDIDEAEAAKYPCENTVTTWTQTRLKDGTLQTP
ncbi:MULTISPECIES: enolase C-terminal domain-like protein [unclassified Burkholderia]|uniref:enolase C-terminal domain-like protein n=1 Tax=unclassified Burkholderia TaxID=2613784 RepID=UPI000F56A96F|nr:MULTISPECIES: enolase C-terminal domain-like protein [unclassified Burkholderia]RQR69826.1 starvation-sensing protein RspA [Burkholderia sp. Bp9012]RQR73319.1 starvation-sensing protein RspA [Burkholderia sp. Bp9011]RQR85179.1 starvation-sensing protein RspA [Burkholderia sp. Bp9010]RQZ40303.1 starvation-sensing protein RspA [Burkholderia sp. Bp9099]